MAGAEDAAEKSPGAGADCTVPVRGRHEKPVTNAGSGLKRHVAGRRRVLEAVGGGDPRGPRLEEFAAL